MNLSYSLLNIELKHRFTIAAGSRKFTPIALVIIEHQGIKGYGEASLPPYLGEDHTSVESFFGKINLSKFKNPEQIIEIIEYVHRADEGNYAAKAALDIALHDLLGKYLNIPLHKHFGLKKEKAPYTSYTIGMDQPAVLKEKILEAEGFRYLKIKLGSENDRKIIEFVREVTNVPLYVDVNQGWKDKYFAIDMINWLARHNVILVEQPLPKEMIEETALITEQSPIPVIADEAVQTSDDIEFISGAYSGINIKLMKCGGINEAIDMINTARRFNLKIMLGCMTETSCAISAAAQISPLADFADLDGNLLIKNDPFEGVKTADGKIILNDMPGIGCNLLDNSSDKL